MGQFQLVGTASNVQEIADVMNIRRVQLGLTMSEMNDITGFADRYVNKIFASGYRCRTNDQLQPLTMQRRDDTRSATMQAAHRHFRRIADRHHDWGFCQSLRIEHGKARSVQMLMLQIKKAVERLANDRE